jgi:hypothetical protein
MQTLFRIPRMTLAEIACRGRQETSKWIERVVFPPAAEGLRRPEQRVRSTAARRAMTRYLSLNAPRLFDAGVVARVQARWPDAARVLIDAADRICAGRFDLLGYENLWFGAEPDWHLDPVRQRRAPACHWSRIDPLNPLEVGDSKIIWELSRHQWLVTLGQAYRLTGDERYANHAAALLTSWLAANPRRRGINWSSSLELSYRLIAWCWALAFLQGSPVLERAPFVRLGESLRDHANHVERYLSHYFSPNTHLTGEALGLVYAGVLFDGFPEAARWRDCGRRILVEQSERQILADGVQFEQATCYHRYTIEIYLHLLLLGDRFDVELPAALGPRVERMFDLLAHVAQPDGSMPDIGDADGGWLLPFVRRAPLDCRGVFAWGASWFERTDLAWFAEGEGAEVGWALGPEGLDRLEKMAPTEPPAAPSRVFPDGGCVVMRSGWDAQCCGLILDAGPLGCPVSSAHGHADLLSLYCWGFGEPWIVDAGTGAYTAEPEWRTYFRGTAAHNTIRIDGLDQAEAAGPFSWRTRPTARLQGWASFEQYDWADAAHDGYRRLSTPVGHRRRVLFVKPNYWVVVDDLDGTGSHQIELRYHVTAIPTLGANGVARLERNGRTFWIVPFPLNAMEPSVETEWRSPAYGQREPAPVLVYRSHDRLPIRVVTILMPMPERSDTPPRIRSLLERETGRLNGLWLVDHQHRVRFDRDALTLEAVPCAGS